MHFSGLHISLFLFAHQDDEYGVFSQIVAEMCFGRRVVCVFVTDGRATADPKVRERESRAVLEALGVISDQILFIGPELGIRDGHLYAKTGAFIRWLQAFLENNSGVTACFVPAWEGGHPDHDLLHALTVSVFSSRKLLPIVRQFPLYNAQGCFPPFFQILSPLLDNGPVLSTKISWPSRLRYLRLCLKYRSQWRSWIGLLPFLLLNYITVGKQQLQPVSISRLTERPHGGDLYYELRGFAKWELIQITLKNSFKKISDTKKDACE